MDAIVEGLRALIHDREARRRLGAQGKDAVNERFTALRMARETLEIYEELLGVD